MPNYAGVECNNWYGSWWLNRAKSDVNALNCRSPGQWQLKLLLEAWIFLLAISSKSSLLFLGWELVSFPRDMPCGLPILPQWYHHQIDLITAILIAICPLVAPSFDLGTHHQPPPPLHTSTLMEGKFSSYSVLTLSSGPWMRALACHVSKTWHSPSPYRHIWPLQRLMAW